MNQAYYSASAKAFLDTSDNEIMGHLAKGSTSFVSQWTIANNSWQKSITILKNSLKTLTTQNKQANEWYVLFEYEIPRLLSRIDVVLIANDIIFIIEFKLDRKTYELQDIRQVEDYALDLSDFHFESRDLKLIPILLAPDAAIIPFRINYRNNIADCLKANENNLTSVIGKAYDATHDNNNPTIDFEKWINSSYKPTPTIIQAAKALFSGQKVETISRSGADEINLSKTTYYVIEKIKEAKELKKKIICFVTGVPGAGKTLVGLNLVHEKTAFRGDEIDTAYFSGNGPLIKVLREALARDDYNRLKEKYDSDSWPERPKKGDSDRKIKTKIQNLHSFIKDGLRQVSPPTERIVIFDEAQRCWNAEHFYNQNKRNQNRETNPFEFSKKSEPELLFEFMNRHEDWSVIIALVGNGQEINTGEAGIAEWGRVLAEKFNNWEVHISPDLLNKSPETANQTLFEQPPRNLKVYKNVDLHLTVSQRSFKANKLNDWVNALLFNDSKLAFELANNIHESFPIKLTRDINVAKNWLRKKVIGTKRIGLVASSGAVRLKPYAINVKETIDEAYWFLNDEKDIRSSYYLEVVATEFAVQGLELDFVGVCWDADLRRNGELWDFKNFVGNRWQSISLNNNNDKQYLVNTYRVLLTRAREGMVIFVPTGDQDDETRLPEFYNPIYEYLKSCGIQEL